MSSVEKSFLNYITNNIDEIPSVEYSSISEFLDFIEIMPPDMGYGIKVSLLAEFRADIIFCNKYSEQLTSSGFIISPHTVVLKHYDKSLKNTILSSKIAYSVRPYKKKIKNLDDIVLDEDVIEISDLELLCERYNIPSVRNIDILKNSLKTKLKPHQEKSLLELLDKGDRNICIAETGSGKTLLAIAYAEYLYKSRNLDKIIVIAERNEDIFRQELLKHTKTYYVTEKYEICTYYNMQSRLDTDRDYSNTLFIFDEIHLLKNKSDRSGFINSLGATIFLGLTATIVDKVKDLKNLFKTLSIHHDKSERLIDVFSRYSIRMDAPEKNYNHSKIKVTCTMPEDLKLSIKKILEKMQEKSDRSINTLETLASIIRPTIDIKKDCLIDILPKFDGKKILIFIQYIESQQKILNYLKYIYPDQVAVINGSMNNKEKDKIIKSFKDPEGDIRILISSSVLSASYNLQEASVMIIAEQNYSVIKKIQTEGRVLRIGQEEEVYIYNIIPEGSIEDRIYEIVEEKRDFLNSIQSVTSSDIERMDQEAYSEIMNVLSLGGV